MKIFINFSLSVFDKLYYTLLHLTIVIFIKHD